MEQSIMPEFGDKLELLVGSTLIFTSSVLVWFLIAEHIDNKKRNDIIVSVQQLMYDRLVINDMEQRFDDG
jgi:hypothetical protein